MSVEGVFQQIPTALRLPGVYIEFNNRLAGGTQMMRKVLFIGQRLDPGTKPTGQAFRVTNGDEAEEYFGRGSMLASMLSIAKQARPFVETWGIALDDDAAAVAASGSVDFGGPATAAGTISLYIAGTRIRVGVASGDTGDNIATAVAAAINADTSLPVTAQVNGSTATQVDITARNAGEVGNDIDIRLNYYDSDEKLPAGVTATVTAMSGGSANPDIANAIAGFGDEWWNWIVNPYTDSANMTALEDELDSRWGPMRQIGCRAFTAFRGTHSESGTWGNGRNSPHVTTRATNIAPEPPYLWASVAAVVDGASLSIDPARPLQRLELPYLKAPVLSDRWSDTQRNQLLFDGMSTYTVDSDGTIRVEHEITNYQENSAGIADTSYLNLNTPETLERYRFEQRARISQKFPRHKLAHDADLKKFGPGQPIATESVIKGELLNLYQDLMAVGWVQDYAGYKDSLIVEVDTPNSRVNVIDSPQLVGQYRIHAAQVQFRL